jgi:hypothetical protein
VRDLASAAVFWWIGDRRQPSDARLACLKKKKGSQPQLEMDGPPSTQKQKSVKLAPTKDFEEGKHREATAGTESWSGSKDGKTPERQTLYVWKEEFSISSQVERCDGDPGTKVPASMTVSVPRSSSVSFNYETLITRLGDAMPISLFMIIGGRVGFGKVPKPDHSHLQHLIGPSARSTSEGLQGMSNSPPGSPPPDR